VLVAGSLPDSSFDDHWLISELVLESSLGISLEQGKKQERMSVKSDCDNCWIAGYLLNAVDRLEAH